MPPKTLTYTAIASSMRRLVHVLAATRSFLIDMFKKMSSSSNRPIHFFIYFTRNKKNKIHCGSFRLHYNWCSSRFWSVPTSVLTDDLPASSYVYYDSTWQCGEVVGSEMYNEPSELSGYLRWLEEKKKANGGEAAGRKAAAPQRNEIDELADMFIAQCREKFILEKQESDRRFHERLARSM